MGLPTSVANLGSKVIYNYDGMKVDLQRRQGDGRAVTRTRTGAGANRRFAPAPEHECHRKTRHSATIVCRVTGFLQCESLCRSILRVVDGILAEPLLITHLTNVLHRAASDAGAEMAALPGHACGESDCATQQSIRPRDRRGFPPADGIAYQNANAGSQSCWHQCAANRFAKKWSKRFSIEEFILTGARPFNSGVQPACGHNRHWTSPNRPDPWNLLSFLVNNTSLSDSQIIGQVSIAGHSLL
jgi:hypothetical protein